MNAPAISLAGIALTVVLAISSNAQESAAPFTGFNGTGVGYAVGRLPERLAQLLIALLNQDAVKAELNLSPDQVATFRKLKEESRTSLELDSTVKNAATLEEHDRALAANRARLNKAAKDVQEKIKSTLRPEQARRLTEISIQMRGIESLADTTVAKELGITDEQLRKLAAISTDIWTRTQANRKAGPNERAALRAELRRETVEKVAAILTADQKATFEKMKGTKIDISLSNLFEPRQR